jgi:hypothetical protein
MRITVSIEELIVEGEPGRPANTDALAARTGAELARLMVQQGSVEEGEPIARRLATALRTALDGAGQ